MLSVMIQNGDIVIKDKLLQTVNEEVQKKQRTAGLLQIVKGELFYNANMGLDYSEILEINEKGIDDGRKKIAVAKALEYDDNIEKIIAVNITQEGENSGNQAIDVELSYTDGSIATVGGVIIG